MQGSHTCTSAVLCTVGLPSTNIDNKIVNCDEATFQPSRIVTLSKINSMCCHDCHVTSIQMSAIVTLRKQNGLRSFHAKKKTNFFVHVKCPSKVTTHASTTECLCLSHSVIFVIRDCNASNLRRPVSRDHRDVNSLMRAYKVYVRPIIEHGHQMPCTILMP